MTALPKKKYISPEEYLAIERDALERHEYFLSSINCKLLMEDIYDKVDFDEE